MSWLISPRNRRAPWTAITRFSDPCPWTIMTAPDSITKKSLPSSPAANRTSPASTRRARPSSRNRARCSASRRGKAPSRSGVSGSPAPIAESSPVTPVKLEPAGVPVALEPLDEPLRLLGEEALAVRERLILELAAALCDQPLEVLALLRGQRLVRPSRWEVSTTRSWSSPSRSDSSCASSAVASITSGQPRRTSRR